MPGIVPRHNDKTTEVNWSPLPGYERCYEVSDQGQIRGVPVDGITLSKDNHSLLVACGSCGEEQKISFNFTASVDDLAIEDPRVADLQEKAKWARDPVMKEGYQQLAARRVGANALLKTFAGRAPAAYEAFGRDAFRPEPSAESEDDTS